jgi:hypothetical protein
MKIYDYNRGDIVEISNAQYDFMQSVIKHSGRLDAAIADYPVSAEQIDLWRKDPEFWPVLEGYLSILIRSHGLSPEYIKDYLLSTLYGTKKPTKEQLTAIAQSIRALGMGLQSRTVKANITPSNTTIEFVDGLDEQN